MPFLKPVLLVARTRVGEFVGPFFVIKILCACGHEREPRGEFIRRIIGIDTTLEQLESRLRCHLCGKRGAKVEIYRLPR